MFAALMNGLINLLATFIQIICTPVNLIVTNALPGVSDFITKASTSIITIVGYMEWAIGIIPPILLEVFSFILLCEVAKHTIFTSSNVLAKVWVVLQKIKFW